MWEFSCISGFLVHYSRLVVKYIFLIQHRDLKAGKNLQKYSFETDELAGGMKGGDSAFNAQRQEGVRDGITWLRRGFNLLLV